MGSTLKVLGADVETLPERQQTASQLDQSIREHLREFVKLGQELLQMRDGHYYKDLPGFNEESTWPDYLKTLPQEITPQHAGNKIRASLVYQAIESCLKPAVSGELPLSEKQLRPLCQYVARFKKTANDGGKLGEGNVVAVTNPDEVAKQWKAMVAEYNLAKDKYEAEHGEVYPRKLSESFIRTHLPSKYTGHEVVEVSIDSRVCAQLVRKMAAILKLIEEKKLDDFDTLKEVASKEGWTTQDRQWIKDEIKGLDIRLPLFAETLGKLRLSKPE